MIIDIEWETFHLKFFNQNTIFVKEHESFFEFITYEGIVLIRSVWKKSENSEENIFFIEKYMSDNKLITKVLKFGEYEREEEELEEVEEQEKEFIQKIENDI